MDGVGFVIAQSEIDDCLREIRAEVWATVTAQRVLWLRAGRHDLWIMKWRDDEVWISA